MVRVDKPLGVKPETAFNLKSLFDKIEETEETSSDEEGKPATPFGIATLEKYWAEFLKELESERKVVEFNVLQTAKISLKENFIIDIEFNSSSMIYEFEHIKDRLILFLREKLNNYVFEFNPVLAEGETENYIKTKAEIFKEMVEKNPVILKFKQDLGLDYISDE